MAPPKMDRYGDPLPPGAIHRLGTTRMSHRDAVMFVQFTADGKEIISGSSNYWLHYWDIIKGAQRRDFEGAGNSFAISGNGKRFATVDDQATILLWDVDTGKELAQLYGHRKEVAGLALSVDGNLLASVSHKHRLGLWDAAKGRPLRELLGHKGRLGAIAFSPDGKRLAAVGEDKHLYLWSTSTGALTRRSFLNTAASAIAFAPDGKVLVPVSDQGVQAWDIGAERVLWQNAKVRECHPAVAISPDGKLVAFAKGHVIHLREMAGGRELRQLIGHHESVLALAFSPDSGTLVSGGADYAVRLWDVASGRQRFPEHRNFGRVMSAKFLSDGKTLLIKNENGLVWWQDTMWFWDPNQGRELHSFKAQPEHVKRCSLSPDGTRIAQVMEDGELRVCAVPSGKLLHKLPGNPGLFEYIALSPNNKLLADVECIRSEAAPGRMPRDMPLSISIRLVDLASGKVIREFKSNPWHPNSVLFQQFSTRFSADGQLLLGWFHFNLGFQFDVATGEFAMFDPPVAALGDPYGTRQKLVVVPGKPPAEKQQAKADDRVWENLVVEAHSRLKPDNIRQSISTFTIPYESAHHLVLPGNRIVASAYDATIVLWSIPTGKEIGRFVLPYSGRGRTFGEWTANRGNSIWCLDASADGRLLVSGHFNGTALVWDMAPYHAMTRISSNSLDAQSLEEFWKDLGADESAKAWKAIWILSEHSEQSVKLLQARLQAVTAPDPKHAAGWIRDLGSEDFEVRQRAMKEIRRCNRRVSHYLRNALADNPPLEVERRLRLLLAEFAQPEVMTPERVRQRRALEVLEQVHSPEARVLLRSLADGAPDAWLTRQAKASLARQPHSRP